VTFIARVDTYLVRDGKATYHVAWRATTRYDIAKGKTGSIEYWTGGTGAVTGLPPELKEVLDTRYAGNTIT
jgi:hypothetical protein